MILSGNLNNNALSDAFKGTFSFKEEGDFVDFRIGFIRFLIEKSHNRLDIFVIDPPKNGGDTTYRHIWG